ncbi:pol-like protein [Aphelenchoides avenae]|nr:pol-like protein [Aphelenchus avenae]
MRSTEDQLLYLTQSVKDGFNKKPAKRTLLTLVDFSRAFDRVWRTGLYSKMIAMGMPTCIVQWVHGFLSDRRARVRIDETNSRSFPLKAGTPQGSVLSPLLPDDMPEGVEASLYADDLALWAQVVDLADIKARMQTALDKLATWAECWKMQINVDKTVVTFFTTEASQSRWRPELTVNGQQLPYDAAPTFLGVTLDWSLRFTAHAKKVRSKMTKRLNFLSALRGTKWGCSRRIMRNLYNAYVRSVADYGGAAWMPAANKTALDQVDAANRRAARIITGCLRSSPTELLLEEADLMPTEHRRDQLCSIAFEKALRLPEDNPRHRCATQVQRQRLPTQSSFREHAKALGNGERLGDLPREPLRLVPLVPPWKLMPNVTLSADLLRTTRKADDPLLRRLTAGDTLRHYPPRTSKSGRMEPPKEGTQTAGTASLL